MIRFPTSVAEAAGEGTPRAGGTDLHERRRQGLHAGPLVDLRDLAGLDAVERVGPAVRIGALVRIADLAAHPELGPWQGLREAAGGLATPQVRHRATVGGNLLQEVRCWYFRHPDLACAKKGGPTCLARAGDALFHAYDGRRGPCVAPHPSTLAVALLAWDATALLDDGSALALPELLGDGSDARATHALPAGRLLVGVELPDPAPGEGSRYVRAAHRAYAEWPLIEVVARISLDGERIAEAAVAVGALTNRPERLTALEGALIGAGRQDVGPRVAAALGPARDPLPDTSYKLEIARTAIEDAVHGAMLSATEGARP